MSNFLDNLAPGQIQAFMRHVYTGIAASAGTALFLGLSQDQFDKISAAVHQIGDGVTSVATGIAVLIPIISGIYAALSASRANRLKALNADPQIQKIETVPGTAAAEVAATIPGTKVT